MPASCRARDCGLRSGNFPSHPAATSQVIPEGGVGARGPKTESLAKHKIACSGVLITQQKQKCCWHGAECLMAVGGRSVLTHPRPQDARAPRGTAPGVAPAPRRDRLGSEPGLCPALYLPHPQSTSLQVLSAPGIVCVPGCAVNKQSKTKQNKTLCCSRCGSDFTSGGRSPRSFLRWDPAPESASLWQSGGAPRTN